ncbi:hypothetical protein BURK2_03975 [Burkholderiales bacterium]|nr:hypothetical protein BURK2_03975 [Burkholderiales bacterium]
MDDEEVKRRTPPLVAAVTAQGVAAAFLFLATTFWPQGLEAPFLLVFAQGLLAAAVSAAQHAPRWWWLIHALFPMAIYGALQLPIDPVWYLIAFIFTLAIFWRTDVSRVPLFLSNKPTAEALLQLLPAHAAQIIDLGCGDGGLLRHLARARPDCRFVGIEHAPLTWAWAALASRKQPNLSIRRGDFWRESLAPYALVYAFLSPEPMPRLIAHARKTMTDGSLLVSNSFMAPGAEPEAVIDVDDRRQTRLYCYRMLGLGRGKVPA